MSLWFIVPLASLVCYSVLLAINLKQGRQEEVNIWFGLYLLSMIVWSLGSFLAHLPPPGIDTLFWNRVLTAGSTAMPFVFYGFVQFFLHKERKALAIFALVFFLATELANILGLVIESAYVTDGKLINRYGPAVALPSIAMPLMVFLSAWDLIAAYRKTKDTVYRNRLKYLLSVIIVTFCGMVTNSTRLSVYPIDIGFNVVSAGLLAYAILRYQLLDISVVIRKSLMYSIPTIFIGAVYFLVINFIWRLFDTSSSQEVFLISLLVAILSAMVAQPVRDKAQHLLDQFFFREKHDIGLMLQRVNHTAASVLDINALTEMILNEIIANLHVSCAAFFLKRIDQEDFEISTQAGLSIDPAMRLRKDHPTVQWLAANDQALSEMDMEVNAQFLSLWGREREELAQMNAELFIPVKAKRVLVGILAIGPKRSGDTFSLEDHATLMALASQTAVAIENARLFMEARQRTAEMTTLNAIIQAELGERQRAEKALKESEERFRRLAENAPDLIFRYRIVPDMGFEFISPAVKEILGYPPEEFYADPQLYEKLMESEVTQAFGALALKGHAGGPAVMRFTRSDGSIVWMEHHTTPIFDEAGSLAAVEGIARDITRRQQDEEELAARISQLEKHNREINILNEMGDNLQACKSRNEAYPVIHKYLQQLFPVESGAVYVMDADKSQVGKAVAWGAEPFFAEAFEREDCWALRRGKPHLVESMDNAMHCQHIAYPAIHSHLCMPMIAQGEAVGQLTLAIPKGSDGEAGELSPSKQQLALTVAEHIALALANLKLNEKLREQAIRDPLTGLFNRRYMEETLERELSRAARKNSALGIIFIDIDHFKLFNDHFGHDAGDRVLRELGRFLMEHIRREDIACRYGGEEFILILPETSLEAVGQRAEEIRQGVKQLIITLPDQHDLKDITFSLGISIFPQNGQTAQALLRSADMAVYQAKLEGRDRFVVSRW